MGRDMGGENDDIVERLRRLRSSGVMIEAADEIERLRAEVERLCDADAESYRLEELVTQLKAEIERLRAALNEITLIVGYVFQTDGGRSG